MIRGNDPILLTPGPLTTSLATRQAMLRDWGSWDASFNSITRSLCDDLVRIVNGEGTHVCVPMQGSGTFSVEAAIANVVPRDGKVLVQDEVLNDVVINKGALARIADHEVSLDGQFITTFKSDGVIIATPTGSTAYALAAGGPILHPTLECAVVTPICPHALTQRPFVVPGDQVVNVMLRSPVADVYLTLDGQTGQALQQGDRLEVWRSANRTVLVRNPNIDYFGILRQKLHWGER